MRIIPTTCSSNSESYFSKANHKVGSGKRCTELTENPPQLQNEQLKGLQPVEGKSMVSTLKIKNSFLTNLTKSIFNTSVP